MTEQTNASTSARDPKEIVSSISLDHIANGVEVLNTLTAEDAAAVVLLLPKQSVIELFDKPELEHRAAILAALPRDFACALLKDMSDDMAVDLVAQLPEAVRTELLGGLDEQTRLTLTGLLAYPENTAGAMMTTEFVSAGTDWTISQTMQHIRQVERTRETVYAIYVLEPVSHRLVGVVSLRQLISGEPDANIMTVASPNSPVTTTPHADREEVARLIARHDLLAVPVMDKAGRVLGIVTFDDVIDAIIEESNEDVQKFGGMDAIEEPYLQIGFLQMMRKRGGWLAILFLSEMLTASVMQHFEVELEKAIMLTLFIPLIMSSGGNSGSQATSLLIRSLALREVKLSDWWKVALRELPTGLALGSLLGAMGFMRVLIWQKAGIYDYGEHWLLLAFTVTLTLIGVVTFGSLTGSMLPFLLQRAGFDPASASAPFVATLVDVTGLFIYFSVAVAILRGTLL